MSGRPGGGVRPSPVWVNGAPTAPVFVGAGFPDGGVCLSGPIIISVWRAEARRFAPIAFLQLSPVSYHGRDKSRPYTSCFCGGWIPGRGRLPIQPDLRLLLPEEPKYVTAAVTHVVLGLLVCPFDPQKGHAGRVHKSSPSPESVISTYGAF